MLPPFSEADMDMLETCDAFLGGKVMVRQPREGYRAGADAVMMAASVPAQAGESVLELGCGVGTAALSLCARVAGLQVTGVEVQPLYAALAQANALENKADFTVHQADLANLPADLRARTFDHVMMNPPYFRRDIGRPSPDQGRETAFGEVTPLPVWIDIATRRLKQGGWLTVIHRASRLGDILSAMDERLGSHRIRPLVPRMGRDALTVIVQARKGGRAPLRLLSPLIMHEGDRHPGDTAHFTPLARAILQSGAALPMESDMGDSC